jgi:hypothetical protein
MRRERLRVFGGVHRVRSLQGNRQFRRASSGYDCYYNDPAAPTHEFML